jgi:hypothetical protein
VVYTSADATGALKFTPVPDQSGAAVITVFVEDGGPDGDLNTSGDNLTVTKTVNVTVNPLNDAPTLSPLSNLTIFEDSAEQTVNLSGITAGGGESQPLKVTAISSNTALIPSLNITYASADNLGILRFTPTARTTGSSTITVSVEDGGIDQDLSTAGDNRTITRSFTVAVQPIRPVILSPIGSTTAQRPLFVWTAVPEAVSYTVWLKNVSTGQTPFHIGSSASTQYQMPLNIGIGRFDLYVQAVFADGNVSAWSLLNRFNVSTPVYVNPLPQRQTTYRPTLSWAAVPGAVQYDVWLDNRSTGQTQIYRTFVTGTQWTPDGDLPLSRYQFWARGIAADGTPASWSPRADFMVATPPQALSPLTSTFNRQQTFTWTSVLGATSYGFYLQNNSTGTVVANVSGLPTPSWTPTTPLADGSYVWWAIAESTTAGFRSNWSARTDLFIGGRPVVTAPTALVSTLRPVIRWSTVLGATTYDVWLNRTFEGQISTNIFKVFGVSGNSLEVPSNLVNRAEYRVWVRAVSATGEASLWSNSLDFTVLLGMLPDTATQPNDSGNPQPLAAKQTALELPQLRSLLADEVMEVSKPGIRNPQPATEEQVPAQTATRVAIVSHPQPAVTALEPENTNTESSVDQSIQEIVDALLSGNLNFS